LLKKTIIDFEGMTATSCNRKTSLEDYGVDMDSVYAITGAFGRIGKSTDPNLWDQFNAEETHNLLRCTHETSHWLVKIFMLVLLIGCTLLFTLTTVL